MASGEADCVAVEGNYGGDMALSVITHAAESMGVAVPRLVKVWSTGKKHIRFERVTGAKYERGEMAHVGAFPELEDEITQYTPVDYEGEASPNRGDALVLAIEELFPVRKGPSPSDMMEAWAA